MKRQPELIVMLTYDDLTVENAYEVFEECKTARARYWGCKEKGLSVENMKHLFQYMKQCGKGTALEVVAYTEQECLRGAQVAVDCGCDILMGTIFYDSVNDFCKRHQMKYMPFVGDVSERPSILDGTIESMIEESEQYLRKGVYGIDLLGYRYTGDAKELNKCFTEMVKAPVCIAGSINSYQRLEEVKQSSPWAFTIGSAFFDRIFGESICEQINKVCDYMEEEDD